jgi:hypothetical protein
MFCFEGVLYWFFSSKEALFEFWNIYNPMIVGVVISMTILSSVLKTFIGSHLSS